MTDAPDAVARAARAQSRAAAPSRSAWVSANAGSGKTRVLTERVARLLLEGWRPEKILCLTYTKAAAAEMTNRLSDTLGRWALADDGDLAKTLAALARDEDAPRLGRERLAAARRLFAQALETPGGLRIQTIHAFCDAVLRRFPLEACVSPDFVVLEEARRAALAERARDRLARAAAEGRDDAFDAVAAHLTDEGLDGLIADILAKRRQFAETRGADDIAAAFGVSPRAFGERPVEEVVARLDRARLSEAARLLSGSGKRDAPIGEALGAALDGGIAELRRRGLIAALRTGAGAPRKLGGVPVKAVHEAEPWIRPLLEALSAALEEALERENALISAERAVALHRFAAAFLAAYGAEKRAVGALDYDDLISGVARLFRRSDMAAWALYKLDGGVDHLLVDEAQDTAAEQWAVVEALTAEFHAGEGARGQGRTIFVVGDEKQSIYSFQGADPALFGTKRAAFRARAEAAGAEFAHKLELLTSFRSAPAVLNAVDRTFAAAPEGLSAAARPPEHVAAFPERVGRVDVWPLIPKEDAAEPPHWTDPVDAPSPADPRLRLARMLAAEISRWVHDGERLPGEGRPIRPGDVMVLLRKRSNNPLAPELVRQLKRLHVPVSGADRLRLDDSLAVRDLRALARFALTPQDDLTLAALLRSPLCGLGEEELFALAWPRAEGESLWRALSAAEERHPEIVAFLRAMRNAADFRRPYEFLEMALTERDGRRRLLARLGTEAEDPVDELLSQALAFESEGTPSLEGFLAWLDRGAVSIKREMDKGVDEVRVMTVHGAKGLEAPVVILPDGAARTAARRSAILPLDDGLPVWAAPKAEQAEPLRRAAEAAARRELEESRRLLYVAMTRAERWLIVCGAGEPQGETWRGLVHDALSAEGGGGVRAVGPPGLDGPILRLQDPGRDPGRADPGAEPRPAAEAPPPWALARAAGGPETAQRRAASALLPHAPEGAAPSARDAETARRRGEAIHALLERLPDAAPDARAATAEALMSGLWPDGSPVEQAAACDEALAALALPDAAPIFAPGAIAEAALSVELPGLGRVAGRLDRVAIGAERVLAVDFKTDAAPPASPEAAPAAYLAQMAAYREALRRLHPGRAVTVALLWTAVPRLDALPDALLDAALAGAGAS